jgi:hypothetical protein
MAKLWFQLQHFSINLKNHEKQYNRLLRKKYRSFKAKMLNSVLEVSDKNPSDGSCLPLE